MYWGVDQPPTGAGSKKKKKETHESAHKRSRPKFLEAVEESWEVLYQFANGEAIYKGLCCCKVHSLV